MFHFVSTLTSWVDLIRFGDWEVRLIKGLLSKATTVVYQYDWSLGFLAVVTHVVLQSFIHLVRCVLRGTLDSPNLSTS